MEVGSHWHDMVCSRGRLHGDGHLMVPGVCHILDICDRICDTSCHLIVKSKLKENNIEDVSLKYEETAQKVHNFLSYLCMKYLYFVF